MQEENGFLYAATPVALTKIDISTGLSTGSVDILDIYGGASTVSDGILIAGDIFLTTLGQIIVINATTLNSSGIIPIFEPITNPSIAGLGNRLFVSSPDTGYLEVIDRTNGQSLFVSNDQEIRFRRMVVEQGGSNDEFRIFGANQTGSFLLVLDVNLTDLQNVGLNFLRPDQQGGTNPGGPLVNIAVSLDTIAVTEPEIIRLYNKNTFVNYSNTALPGGSISGLALTNTSWFIYSTTGFIARVNYTIDQPFLFADIV